MVCKVVVVIHGLHSSNDLSAEKVPTSSQQQLISYPEVNISQGVHGNIPANTNWTGLHDFDVSFGPQEKATKSTNWTYSEIRNKLYVNIAVPCPIRFHVLRCPPAGSIIRAMPIFSKPENVTDVVKRCLNHSHPSDPLNEGHPAPDHLIRCDNYPAQYVQDAATGRLSVVAMYESPQVGMNYSTYLYKFMCLGSCVGGLNRRPIQVIFTLEHDGECLGRRVVETRICACPGRDRRLEEKQFEKLQSKRGHSKTLLESMPPAPNPPRLSICHGNDDFVTISIRRRHYEHIKVILDALDSMDVLTQEQKATVQQRQAQRQILGFQKVGKRKRESSSSEEET